MRFFSCLYNKMQKILNSKLLYLGTFMIINMYPPTKRNIGYREILNKVYTYLARCTQGIKKHKDVARRTQGIKKQRSSKMHTGYGETQRFHTAKLMWMGTAYIMSSLYVLCNTVRADMHSPVQCLSAQCMLASSPIQVFLP